MKLKLTVILLSVLVLGTASALPPRGLSGPQHGPGHGPEARPGPPLDLGALLDLTGDTLAKVDALSEQQHLALFRLHREQMRAEQALRTQFRGELAKILSPDQLSRFEQLRSKRHPPTAGMRSGAMQCRDAEGQQPTAKPAQQP